MKINGVKNEVLTELQEEDDEDRCVRKLRYCLRLVYGLMGYKSCHRVSFKKICEMKYSTEVKNCKIALMKHQSYGWKISHEND